MWTKGHELKYWHKNGIRKGTFIYNNYKKSFDLDKYNFKGKNTIDIGCGPFGGVFCEDTEILLYPVDILAEEYNKMKHSKVEIIFGDLSKKLPFQDSFFDFLISTNAIDHIPDMQHGFNEIYRILKPGGTAFVHVHLRNRYQLNKAHVHILDLKKTSGLASKSGFDIVQNKEDTDWVNDRTDRNAAYMVLNK